MKGDTFVLLGIKGLTHNFFNSLPFLKHPISFTIILFKNVLDPFESIFTIFYWSQWNILFINVCYHTVIVSIFMCYKYIFELPLIILLICRLCLFVLIQFCALFPNQSLYSLSTLFVILLEDSVRSLTLHDPNFSFLAFLGHNPREAIAIYRLIIAILVGYFWWYLFKMKLKFSP